MTDQPIDPIAARRNALAALIRAVCWPAIVASTLWYYQSSIERAVSSLSSVSVAGIEIKQWKQQTTLSASQIRIVRDFPDSDVVDFVLRFGSGTTTCQSFKDDKMDTLVAAGLVVPLDQRETEKCYGPSQEGRGLLDALMESLRDLVKRQLSRSEQ